MFNYFANGENAPEWMEGIKSAKRIAGKPLHESSVIRYDYETKAYGKRFRYEWDTYIDVWEPPIVSWIT